MKKLTILLIAFMIISGKISGQIPVKKTSYYITFLTEVVVLSDSADAGHQHTFAGAGLCTVMIKDDEYWPCTVIDVATGRQYKMHIYASDKRYEDITFQYRDTTLGIQNVNTITHKK